MSSVNSLLGSLISQQNQSLNQSLSKDQLAKLDDILSKFDAKNFTKADFQSLGQQLKEAGIKPSEQVKNAIEAKGIDVSKFVPQQAQTTSRSNQTYGPPYTLDLSQPAQEVVDGNDPASKLTDEQKATVKAIFEKYKDAPKTKETFENIQNALKAAGITPDTIGGGDNKPQAAGKGEPPAGGPPGGKPPAGGAPAAGGGGKSGGVTYDDTTDDAAESSKRKVRPQVGSVGADWIVDDDGNINQRLFNQMLQQIEQQAHRFDVKQEQ